MHDPLGSFSGRPPLTSSESALGVEIGSMIAGKYRVERVIGKGGMGVVVAASQPELARTVAIKLIRADGVEDRSATARLLREAKAAASIQSEHVARVLDVGTLDSGVPFIVMEYLDGSDLQTWLEREGPMRPADAVDFLLQACEAIAEAHRNGIVHRDLKPANLFIARLPGGRSCVKVVDFGISKTIGRDTGEPLTQPASVVGSLYHMAPEQMRGAAVDARTDVWALGLLLYEMLTGQRPFGNQSWPEVAAQVLSEAGPLLADSMQGVSEDVQAVIHKCLSRAPQQRFGTVAELAVALSRFGSRRAHLSLERIVQLATSTGSLSALALEPTEPARDSLPPFAETRPVPVGRLAPGGFEPVQPARGTGETPRRATPATPFPVSTASPPTVASPRWRLVFGVAGALVVLAPAVVWMWPGAPDDVVTESERRAPLSPLSSPAAETRSLEPSHGDDRAGAVAAGRVVIEALPGTAGAGGAARPDGRSSSGSAMGSSPGAAAALRPGDSAAAGSGGAAPAARAKGAAAGLGATVPSPPAAAAGAAETPAPRSPESSSAGSGRPAPAPVPPAERAHEVSTADEKREAAPVEASPPRAPARPPAKARSAWDLHDIEFQGEGKR